MSDKSVILIVVVILFLFLIYTTLKSRKAAKYDVTVGDVIYKGLVRNRWDSLDDTRDEMCFHKSDGKKSGYQSISLLPEKKLARRRNNGTET